MMGQTGDAALPHYLRAKVYTEEGQKEKAAAELSAAVRLQPDLAAAWSDLGQARKALLDDAGALAAFERAAALVPEDAASQARLGAEYLHQNNPHQAVIHLQKALQLNPSDQTALFNLQLALRQEGQEEQARAIRARLAEILRKKDEKLQNGLTATRLNNEGVKLQQVGRSPRRLGEVPRCARTESGTQRNSFQSGGSVPAPRPLERGAGGVARMSRCGTQEIPR